MLPDEPICGSTVFFCLRTSGGVFLCVPVRIIVPQPWVFRWGLGLWLIGIRDLYQN